MKIKIITMGMLAMLSLSLTSCRESGCTDPNADNYSATADKNTECRYRNASNIDVSNVSTNKANGNPWDGSGDSPDLKINFGKSSSSGFDYSTNTADNATTATLTANTSVKFTNETWKYELVDVDVLGSEVIASGTFNPLQSTTSNVIEITSNGVTFKFKYTIQ
ncbi:MAG: hypothetical protein SGJ10_00415 [Bacteroidota bacterium]|nr:hypothetical protein [Bacteroidota bacterium]